MNWLPSPAAHHIYHRWHRARTAIESPTPWTSSIITMNKSLIQIFLPLADNNGNSFPGDWYAGVTAKLNERFGGVTIYQRAPVTGLWKEEEQYTVKDKHKYLVDG